MYYACVRVSTCYGLQSFEPALSVSLIPSIENDAHASRRSVPHIYVCLVRTFPSAHIEISQDWITVSTSIHYDGCHEAAQDHGPHM